MKLLKLLQSKFTPKKTIVLDFNHFCRIQSELESLEYNLKCEIDSENARLDESTNAENSGGGKGRINSEAEYKKNQKLSELRAKKSCLAVY